MNTLPSMLLPPPAISEALLADWKDLTSPTTSPEPFDPESAKDLPAPARRWLRHAIAPGTPLCRKAVLGEHGMLRLDGWRPFKATEALAPLEGYVWLVSAVQHGLPIQGFDRYSSGTGQRCHKVFDLITVMNTGGPDIDRNAAARQAFEITWVPGAALAQSIGWEAVDDDRVTLCIPIGSWVIRPTLTISRCGSVVRMSCPRWTDTSIGLWHDQPAGFWHEEIFTAILDAERTFGGYTIPTHAKAGWTYGTPLWEGLGALIDITIDAVSYR